MDRITVIGFLIYFVIAMAVLKYVGEYQALIVTLLFIWAELDQIKSAVRESTPKAQ